MLPCLIVLVLLLICPSAGQLSGQPLTKGTLKTELLANLNKHSDSEEEKLEMWSAGAPPPATTTPINLFGAPRIFEPPFSLTNQPPGGKENPMKPTKPKAPPLLSTGFRFEPTVSAPNVGMPLSPEHADDIRNWRQRFYKIFKNRAKAMKKKVAREPPKVVVHMNDTTQPQIDKNFQVLMARKDPSWLSEDKVKAFARDKKGHIIRLFGVESSGYRYNFTQPELPQASYQSMYPQSQGPVYIPAANLPTQPSLQPAKYEEASVHTSRAPTSFKSYMTQTPEPIRLLSVFAPTTMAPTLTAVGETSDSMLTSEVDASPDYNNPTVEQQSDCTTGQCDNDQGGESHEKCNSARLQAIIQNNIVPGDAEASKRAVQTQAELELSQFFNVVCGTGFFSYIAHTDEFCQASSGGVNCYAFSPVCSLRPGPQAPVAPVPQVAPTPLMGLGALSPMPMGLPFGKARKKAVVNRN
ncbi:hypothetical protein QR680_006530 [Steinernema hermaphroditum]|uniref:Ground-like domain-containing protein n=1 Tax=Steinernema hermaphroditum TaxID=289476 RepID=A0AA39LXK5_9BILA|nr:hypothetical protein QR680_006530 [Steinernema hermaphroditum]